MNVLLTPLEIKTILRWAETAIYDKGHRRVEGRSGESTEAWYGIPIFPDEQRALSKLSEVETVDGNVKVDLSRSAIRMILIWAEEGAFSGGGSKIVDFTEENILKKLREALVREEDKE